MAENNDLNQLVPTDTPIAGNEEPRSAEPAAQAQPEAPVQDQTPEVSYFYGTTLQLIGWRLLGFLLCILTLGIGTPWAQCMVYRWQINHTTVGGKDLHFNGKGHQLLGKYLLWGLLIIITFGIYTIFLPVRVRKWFLSHTSISTGKEQPQESGIWIFTMLMVLLLGVMAVLVLVQNGTDKSPSQWQNFPVVTAPAIDATAPHFPQGGNDQGGNNEGGNNQEGNSQGGNDQDGNNGGAPTGQAGQTGQTDPPATSAPSANAAIIGAPWTYARYDEDTGRLHLGNYYMFNADGTFVGSYTDRSYYFDGDWWVWDASMGAGGQDFEGTYEFDGSTLKLTYTYMEWVDTVPAPQTFTAYVEHGHGSILYIDGTPYYTGNLETISNLLCPNPPVSSPAPTPPADPAIVGTWTDAIFDNKLLTQVYYTFASDGTFSGAYGDRSYIYSTAEGWIYDVSAGSGSQRFGGTYRYDGSSLVLTFDFMEWDSIPDPRTYSAYIDGGVLYIDSRAHYQGSTNEIGNLLCPDPISAGAAMLDASIFGTWHGFRFNGDRLEQWKTYIFSSDGTVEFCTQDTYYQYSEETGLSCYGSGSDSAYTSYRYNGTTLSFTNDHRTAIISGNTLTINGETYYRGDPDTIALQLFTQQ